MAKIQWQTVFETKVPSIDMQHKRLVAMINQLEDAVDSGKGVVNEEIGSVPARWSPHRQRADDYWHTEITTTKLSG